MTLTTSEPLSSTDPSEDVAAACGWYPDPYFKGFVRFWDGQQLVGCPRRLGGWPETDVDYLGLQGVAHTPSRGWEPAPTVRRWDAAVLIDAAVGTVAGIRPLPRFGTPGGRAERSTSRHRYRSAGFIILGLLVAIVGIVVLRSGPNPHAAPTAPLDGAAFAHDAPDPDVLLVGSTYYAYTTGTSWGN